MLRDNSFQRSAHTGAGVVFADDWFQLDGFIESPQPNRAMPRVSVARRSPTFLLKIAPASFRNSSGPGTSGCAVMPAALLRHQLRSLHRRARIDPRQSIAHRVATPDRRVAPKPRADASVRR